MKRRRTVGERLRRGAAMDRGAEPQLGSVRDFLQRRNRPASPATLPVGDEVPTGAGPAYVRRLEYADSELHGDHLLGAARAADWAVLAARAKDAAFEHVRIEECLFLDTETTGLSGGAGTTVFLIGYGYFESDRLVLEQTFLRTFSEEPAALHHFAARLAAHPVLVTFVGKSFDRHRLAARLTLHGVDAPILAPRHLDLYYLARRAWGAALPDVRLQTLERRRLGVQRHDDLPGSEAPRAFVDWLRDRTGAIDRVFEHNRLDVLSLVTLLAILGSAES